MVKAKHKGCFVKEERHFLKNGDRKSFDWPAFGEEAFGQARTKASSYPWIGKRGCGVKYFNENDHGKGHDRNKELLYQATTCIEPRNRLVAGRSTLF